MNGSNATRSWWRSILGFRSGNRVWMVVASAFYLLLAIDIPGSLGRHDPVGAVISVMLLSGLVGGGFVYDRRRASPHESIEAEMQRIENELKLARTFHGLSEETWTGLQMAAGERVFARAPATLVEPQRGPATRLTRKHSITFGRSGSAVSYTPGWSTERYEPGHVVLAPVDHGTVIVTNRRAVFKGRHAAREWPFRRLGGKEHHAEPMTTFYVVGRERISGLRYDWKYCDYFRFGLDLALAHHQNGVPDLVARMERRLESLRARVQQPGISTDRRR